MNTKKNSIEFPSPTMISVNGIELEVFEAGKQNVGKPIVLCHGFPENAFSWRFQIPELVKAGYHVIVPNQRGYGKSSCPTEVTEYDIKHLTGDLIALLDYYGYKDATFIGHDWGANIVWSLALLHPERINKIINLALPYQQRGEKPWIEFMEEVFGEDNYFVHFNRQIGVADAILDENKSKFLGNLFRKNVPLAMPEPGMLMINLARAEKPLGEPIMSKNELAVFVSAFEASGFTGGINWYRNLDRNWYLLADVNPIIQHPTLMIYGEQDMIPKSENLVDFVPNVEVVSLNCGHCIQQEKPEETNQAILKWLEQQNRVPKKEIETYYSKSRTDWRNWLVNNHQLKQSVWLVFYKSSTKVASISWSEAVDEALCFGWIDSTKKTIDEEMYMQYFSKRKPNSIWSKVNKDKVDYLISKNLMQEAGYKSIEIAKNNKSWFILDEVEALIIPEDLKTEFDKRVGSLEFYESLSKSAKKILLSWIVLAKRPETKQNRIIEIVESASKNTIPKQFR